MNRILQIFVGVAILAGLTLVPSAAFANHGNVPDGDGVRANTPVAGTHEPMPTPAVQGANPCVVTGGVTTSAHNTIDQDAAVSHGHYEFIDTQMMCVNRPNLTQVNADGGFDGPDQPDTDNPGGLAHGSTNAVAWSNCDGYSGGCAGNANKGDIAVMTTGACNGSGSVKFVRVGTAVEAWGNIGVSCPFSAELQFVPDYTATGVGCFATVGPPPHTHCYGLTGTALVG